MRCLINSVIVCLLVGITTSTTDTYRAGVMNSRKLPSPDVFERLLPDIAKSNVDIFVLPTPEILDSKSVSTDNYDEVLKTASSLAKESNAYVVCHLFERMRCHEKTELIRSNLVFNRQGAVISTYKKPVDAAATCNNTATELGSFITDFGVTFGVLMPEDLVLQNLEGLKGVKNFVVAGEWRAEIPVLAAPQFYTSWVYTTNANLVSSNGVFAGKAGQASRGVGFGTAELKKEGEDSIRHPITITTTPQSEELSRFTVKPLDLAAGTQGVRDKVCHRQFCCEFYVKITTYDTQASVSYGLAAFDGIRHYGGHQHIGTQNCALLPCVGSYKRACDVGSVNNTNIIFDEVTITGSFRLKDSAQYPIILSTDSLSSQFTFEKKRVNNTSRVTVKLTDGQKLLNFGIFGRVFSKDHLSMINYDNYDNYDSNNGVIYNIYEYINGNDVQDFVDYMWIRLRVVIVVVSVYVLEMM